MLRITLILSAIFFFDQSGNCQAEEKVRRIDSIVSVIQRSIKQYIIDSGIVSLRGKESRYYDIYHPDSITKDLMFIDHLQDTGAHRDLITFYYHKNELIKVEYGLYVLDENGQGMLADIEHHYEKGKCIFTQHPYAHNLQYFKFLTADQLYKKGIEFTKKYKIMIKRKPG